MGRRIEVELTSSRDDGSWTWRAAGAKKPKGEVEGSLLYDNAQVGDVVKVEAEFHLDGIEITEVFAPKAKKERSNLLELKTRPLRDDELVTTQRVSKSERGGGEGRGRGRGRGDRGNDRGDRSDRGNRGERKGGPGNRGGERRGPKPEEDRRPRPKRLRPRRVHRDAMLASVTEEHRPIVEQVIKDGMPGVRAAIEKQNAEAKEAGKPEIDARPIMSIAEKNLSKARLAEWRDRADAALADAEELDIRDLRSVVVAGADVARDDESRAIAEQIKATLDRRLETDHAAWLADLDNAVTEARVVRGLRLSSRPVKAGAPLPTEIASKLAQQASEALASDVMQDRWATVLDALAFSPVRGAVKPISIPAEPGEELLAEVRRLSDRIPAIAALFNIDPAQVPKSAKRRRPPRKDAKGKDVKGKDDRGKPDRKSDGGRGERPAKADSKGGRRGEQDRKPKDPSATKPNARPVPGAEKPVEPEPEPTVEDTPEVIDGDSTAATEAEAVETETPEAEAAASETAPEAETGTETTAPETETSETPAEVAVDAEAVDAEAVDAAAADAQSEVEAAPVE